MATKGHPVFVHERIGFEGRRFRVYKFRTMYIDANERLEELCLLYTSPSPRD